MHSAVFLDRDGVLNRLVDRGGRGVSPRKADDFDLLPGVPHAVRLLKQAGFLTVVVTNQPDIARGFLEPAELELMHSRMQRLVSIDAIYSCCHDDADGCDCRKPKPGLLIRASQDFSIRLKASYLVGDSWKDIEAGNSVGCTTFLLAPRGQEYGGAPPDFRVPNLTAAAEAIIGQSVVAGRAPGNFANRSGAPHDVKAG